MAAASSKLDVGSKSYEIFRLDAVEGVERLPYTLRILLENVLRTGDDDDVAAVAGWIATDEPHREINFSPARVLHQDFTGVPAIVDLAAMRNAMHDMGGDPGKVNPVIPSELVIDHSVQVDEFGTRFAFAKNVEREFERSCAGGRARSATCASFRRERGSCTRSISSTSRASSKTAAGARSPTRSSERIRTRR
jgi:aconitate hydratase